MPKKGSLENALICKNYFLDKKCLGRKRIESCAIEKIKLKKEPHAPHK